MLEVYDELFEQFFLFHKDIFMGFFLSWEDEYRDLFLSAKETMFFFLPPCWQGFAFPLARLCHRVGKTLPWAWQKFAKTQARGWQNYFLIDKHIPY